ncbi:MAG TPA: FG-GAP-like repeat-containing protein, partial [Flavobacteriales bacterium]
MAAIGDIDKDGIPDMAMGMPHDSSDRKGVVVVMFMNADGTIRTHKNIRSNTDAFTVSLDAGDAFGNRVNGIGDLNGDGSNDIVVLATGDDDGATDQGALYILFLDATATVLAYQKISDTAGGFTGTMSGGNGFSGALAPLGDMNGDGVVDLGVGAPYSNDGGGTARGALWVLLMNTDGTVSGHRKYSRSSTWPGGNPLTANDINFGFACLGIGDLDGDGVNDIAVTARIQGNGRVYIIRLNADGTIKSYNTIGPPSYGGMTTSVTNSGGHFGWALANLGDLNGDGVTDILASMRMQSDGYTNAGALLALYLNSDGTVQYEEKISQTAGTGATPLGLHASCWFGFQVAALRDLDGDNVM